MELNLPWPQCFSDWKWGKHTFIYPRKELTVYPQITVPGLSSFLIRLSHKLPWVSVLALPLPSGKMSSFVAISFVLVGSRSIRWMVNLNLISADRRLRNCCKWLDLGKAASERRLWKRLWLIRLSSGANTPVLRWGLLAAHRNGANPCKEFASGMSLKLLSLLIWILIGL